MSDVFTKQKRSEVMSRIRSRGNKETEVALAKLMHRAGITGWRRQRSLRFVGQRSEARGQRSGLQVRPDFIFPKQHVAVFVDGCFWHGCPKHSKPAKWLKKSEMRETSSQRSAVSYQRKAEKTRTGKVFWRNKLVANKARDRFVTRVLRRQGWQVVRIWEHSLANRVNVQRSTLNTQRSAGSSLKVVEKIRSALKRR